MTKQEIFNMAYLGLKSQGFEQALSADGESCMYRGAGNNRCAIGWCIPDDKYRAYMETLTPFGSSEIRRAVGASEELGVWLNKLQDCHDGPHVYDRYPDMQRTLEGFAEKHNLTVPA